MGCVAYASRIELEVPIMCIISICNKDLNTSILVDWLKVVYFGGQRDFSLDLKTNIEHEIGMRESESGGRRRWIVLGPIDGINSTRRR
jgi:hypothetical protein